jgi:hypothetical protein
MIAALALRDLSLADWFPDEVFDRDLVVLSIYAIGALAGLSASGRREAALAMGPLHWRPTAPLIVTAIVGSVMPVVIARLSKETSLDKALAAGIAVTILVLILTGAFGEDGMIRRAVPPARREPGTGALVRR